MNPKLALVVLMAIASTTGKSIWGSPGNGAAWSAPPGNGDPFSGFPNSEDPYKQWTVCEDELENTKESLAEANTNSTRIQAELEQTQNELAAKEFEIIQYKYDLAVIEAEYELPTLGGHVVYDVSTVLNTPNTYGVLVCQNITFDFSCEDGEKLKLVWATYGRLRKATCDYEPEFETNWCRAPDAIDVVNKECDLANSAQSCVLSPGIMFPTDPCPGVQKNLEVVFECVQK